jgi:ATP-dependent Zn protease
MMKKRKPTEKLQRTAYHEAGHAVIGWYWRRPIGRVTIVRGKEFLGRTEVPRWGLSDSEHCSIHDLEINIDISLAGKMADRKRFGDEQSGNMGQGRWAGDYMEAAETVKQRIIKTNQHKECLEKIDTFMADSQKGLFRLESEFLKTYGWNVERLMERPHVWGCIEALADKLIEQRELSGEEAKTIIQERWVEMDGDSHEEKHEPEDEELGWGYFRKENL